MGTDLTTIPGYSRGRIAKPKQLTLGDIVAKVPELKEHCALGHAWCENLELNEISIREGPLSFDQFVTLWDKLEKLRLEVYWMKDKF